ncbi:hypothetical protein [Burkholderia sp. Ac-20353]|uniref:hypothetical protein n=1 Tax=Burkholderia sp. Ac-20353 TaxID=2703894 RepID=UPI00197B6926|nr:hypothetical protein [Burkholderia sp. Ac-20353]MBN3785676.1 hypothetical protein [Burkholderia sp. Ac-20353]
MQPLVPVWVAIAIFAEAALLFSRLSSPVRWICGGALAAFLLGCSAVGTILHLIEHWRKQRDANDTMLMEQRFPYCHVKRLSSGEWHLIDKSTGRTHVPPAVITPPSH